jgi:hypothetical protein
MAFKALAAAQRTVSSLYKQDFVVSVVWKTLKQPAEQQVETGHGQQQGPQQQLEQQQQQEEEEAREEQQQQEAQEQQQLQLQSEELGQTLPSRSYKLLVLSAELGCAFQGYAPPIAAAAAAADRGQNMGSLHRGAASPPQQQQQQQQRDDL